ncbi:MAG: hypothetical protein AAFX99_22710, partial [Myxococcota bacterium]
MPKQTASTQAAPPRMERLLDNLEGLAIDLGIAEHNSITREPHMGWLGVRVSIVVTALLLLSMGLMLRSDRMVAPWSDHLAKEGAHRAGKVTWLKAPEPGQWGVGLVEAVPETASNDARDIFVFEGLLNGSRAPFAVRNVGNITRTPDGDDALMAVDTTTRRWFAATATKRGEFYTGMDLFDLHGDQAMARHETGHMRPTADQMRIALIHYQDHGRFRGIGRRSYVFVDPVRSLEVRGRDGVMILSGLNDEKGRLRGYIRAADGRVDEPGHGQALALVEQTEPWVLGSWTTYTVNRVRNISWIGPRKIAALEHVVFTSADMAKQLYYGIVGHDHTDLKNIAHTVDGVG